MIRNIVTITFAALLVLAPASAQRIENRKDRQAARINQGVRSGELTAAEAARLKARERELKQDIRRDRVDGGGLTAGERAKIERRQDRLSRGIAVQKNDGQKAAPRQ